MSGQSALSDLPQRWAFAPEPRRSAAIGAGVRRSLADSVDAILRAMRSAGLATPTSFAEWREALERNPRPSPQLWALYHDLAQATFAQRAVDAQDLAAELLQRCTAVTSPVGAVVTFSVDALGPDVARCLAVVDGDPANRLGLREASGAELARVRALMPGCRALLTAAAPALLDEVDTLGHQVLLGVGDGVRFGGAASVFLWGAVVLNPALTADRIDLAEALAHETAHALLFGLVLGRDLTANDPGERYASPLRADPRPIEGIVHAVYVLGRMVWLLRRLRGSDTLSQAERRRVEEKITRNLALFHDGLRTVDAHARFTPEGAAIFEACRRATPA